MDEKNTPPPASQTSPQNPLSTTAATQPVQAATATAPPKPAKAHLIIIVSTLLIVMLATAVILGLLFFTKNKTTTNNSSERSSNGTATNNSLKGYKEYKDGSLSLMHPVDWKVGMSPLSPKAILLASPDYKDDAQTFGTNTPASNKGYVFALQSNVIPGVTDIKSSTYESTLGFMKASPSEYKNVITTKIDGNAAIQAQYLNTWVLNVFKSDTLYYFSLAAPQKDANQVQSLFKNITQSIKFK